MRIIADTNVLIRIFVDDDPDQSRMASEVLEAADSIAVGVQAVCELVWVLDRHYEAPRKAIAVSVRQLLDTEKVVVNRPAVEAGLAVLEQGGDFADGVIAFEGSLLGGDTFTTFDRKAAKILTNQGSTVQLLRS